ncbi:DUF4190 domain-containing protein [Streptacidiphilus jiangxiensis]|uniref:Septum formation n=1 Tax=Streptacidiphilus jiangxiensis TaxID=235985 RepID=A0A1H7FHQ9_STRJI|nr:DUF4190 domain-containing protein [Streptacidiphilus jiangxiensis]SEK25646.1 Septum formation [Streptacidiphilus jiangxiensis]
MTQTPPPSAAYPQPPHAGQPPRAKLSAFAVLSLVASAVALVPVGVVLGIVALFRTARLGQRGKRLAVVALSLCAAWVAAGMVAIIASAAVIASHSGAVEQFGPGTCFQYHDGVDAAEGVDVIACSQAHDGEVVAHRDLGGSYPGQDAAGREAVLDCVDDSARSLPDAGAWDPSVTQLKAYFPSQDSWDAGLRSAVCVLTNRDHSGLWGDALSGSGLTATQRRVLQLTNETALLRLKLHDLPASGWQIAAALEQRLATADRAESTALDALAAYPPADAGSDVPSALHSLAAEDTTEASQAADAASAITGPDAWQSRLDENHETSASAAGAYEIVRSALGLARPGG